jgi:hypothetical protein
MATIHVFKSMASDAADASDSYRDWASLDPDLLVRIMSLLWPTHREPSRLMLQVRVTPNPYVASDLYLCIISHANKMGIPLL